MEALGFALEALEFGVGCLTFKRSGCCNCVSLLADSPAWRFMGSYKWGYKSPNVYSYPTYNPTYNYP